ncbi:MAG TPA: chemotaxis protein CheB [Flavisolibacter sp.]
MNTIPGNSVPSTDHYIVAIGASAGGLEAIHEFFDNMPANGNLSFVIIQHLSPAYKSLLVELVSKHTHMKVYEASHMAEVLPNCVYVIPNDKLLSIKDGRLMLSDKNFERAPNTAIDFFFKSLAEDQHAKAIAVILSGTGTDGTRGMQAIQHNGGMVLVQDPLTAKFDGMPNSAIASGYADYILSPELMPEEIFNYIKERPIRVAAEGQPDESLLPEVLKMVERHCQYDFMNYKTPTILRRIGRRMTQLNYQKFTDYIEHLRRSPDECRTLGKEFLIGVTKFFRDGAAFQVLREEVLPGLLRAKADQDIVKVWVTACSTGEEAYSIAILIDELLQKMQKHVEVKIFATDIDIDAIEFASRATYPAQSVSELDPAIVQKYFRRDGNQYMVEPLLRKQIVFARHNILKDPPFIKNDLVTCRNMLIYMNQLLQRKVLSTLQFSLNTGGFLFLGPSEIPVSIQENLEEVNGKWKIYRKTGNDYRFTADKFPSTQAYKMQKESQPGMRDNSLRRSLADDFKNVLTQEYGFAAVYIDRNFEVKDAVGDFKKYLSLPDRVSSLQILKMVTPELSVALNTAVRKAMKENITVNLHPVRIKNETGERAVQVFVRPASFEGYMTVVFSENHDTVVAKNITAFNPQPGESINYITELEDELKETRMNLQLAIESLETANEELQSSNEELLSANEELQSSNEELQSLNEELHTLNTEHQMRIRELIELNDDLNNYFRSSEIAQVFVDRNYRIRKFNPVAVTMINLIESDIGRPIEHISTNIRAVNLVKDIDTVVTSGKSVEKEVELSNGAIILMKILPYVRRDQEIDGVVITFVDVTNLKQLNTMVTGILDASEDLILSFRNREDEAGNTVDFELMASNKAADAVLKTKMDRTPTLRDVLPEKFRDEFYENSKAVALEGTSFSREMKFPVNGSEEWFQVTITRMPMGILMTMSNINEKKIAQEKLLQSYDELMQVKENYQALNLALEEKVEERTQEFRFVTDFMPQMVWATRPDGYHEFYNKQWYDYTGLTYEQTKDTGWNDVVHPDDQQRAWKVWNHSLKTGEPYEIEYRFRRYDGEYRWFLGRALPLRDDHGRITKWFGTCTDIHDQKLMNDILEKKVRERTQELQRINSELESSNNELLQFASVASHDLKEPLRKIHMFSNLIRERYQDTLSGDADSYLDRIVKASARMTKLINDLLTFTRLSVNSSYENTDLNVIVDEVMSDLELAINEKNAVIEIGDLPEAEIITGQMRQVFQNIISNALKFTRPGVRPHIKITSSLVSSCDTEARPSPAGKFCRIEVEDNGIGFDNQYSKKIFTIFQRLHGREQYDGTGIGLAITKKIIEKHNGVITASSRENQGSRFTIVLPLQQQYAPTVASLN